MAVAEQIVTKEQTGLMAEVLGWISEHFDKEGDAYCGDLYGAAQVASRRLVASRKVADFWEEYGADTLAHYYRVRVLHPGRRPNGEASERDDADPSLLRAASLYGLWVEQVPSLRRWVRIDRLTKEQAVEVGERYVKSGRTTLAYGEALLAAARRLKSGETIGDRFTPEQIAKFREVK